MTPIGRVHSSFAPALRLGLALLAGMAPAVAAVTGPWVANDQARVRLVAARAATAGPEEASAAIDLGLEFELASGWHVYWKNSGDAGYPPRLDLSRTPALAGAQLLFPAPRRFDLPGGLVSFGYADHVLYPIAPGFRKMQRMQETQEARAAEEVGGERLPPIQARLDYLVCREECIPYSAELVLALEFIRSGSGPEERATAARLAAAREALPADPGAVAGAPKVTARVAPGADASLLLELVATGGTLRAAAPDLFFESHPFFALERPVLTASADGLRFRVPFRALDETQPMPATATFAWTLTGLERDAGSPAARPSPVALAGAASVALPHLRTSVAPPGDGIRPGLGIPLLVLAGALALFLLHRFQRSS